MKLKIKKFIYFVNDITNLLLEKDRVKDKEDARILRIALIIVSLLLIFSVILNLFFYL